MPLSTPRGDDEDRPDEVNDFGPIADVYDQLVSWAPYRQWVNDLEARLRHYGLPRRASLLDAACGTGLSTVPWLEKGYRVTAFDRSRKALQSARSKVRGRNYTVRFLQRDLLELDLDGPFDAAICMHSGLDYLLDEEKLRRALRELRKPLEAGAFLSFDKCLHRPEFYRNAITTRRELPCGEAVLRHSWDRTRRLMKQECTVIRKSGGEERDRDKVVFYLKAVPLDELLTMVQDAGFEVVEKPRPFRVSDPGMGIFRAVGGR